MSDALFLPRELFAPATSATSPATSPAKAAAVQPMVAARVRRSVSFASGEAVAADLLKDLAPANATPVPTERRRTPRPAGARGVDLFIA